MLLQQKYEEQLSSSLGKQPKIPDLFSNELGITLYQNVDIALFELAERHKILSDQNINWLGTYKHATDVWLKLLELHKQESPLPERERELESK
ncbi:MAG: hypothetical protein IT310_02335 [Anaerolineales bacterium]|nr:hypothetical protein [Anaerolineales bacterium]